MVDSTSPDFRLPRAQRLRARRDFAAVRHQGRRVARGCLVVNWLRLPPGATSRLGVVTSRDVGPAVVRSRARRLLRETFRLWRHRFDEPLAVVLVARASIARKKLAGVEKDFLAVLRQEHLLRKGE